MLTDFAFRTILRAVILLQRDRRTAIHELSRAAKRAFADEDYELAAIYRELHDELANQER